MKPYRQEKIREIVENHVVETQEDLAAFLRREHIEVTQATVSRDIRELALVKVPIGGGRSRYALPEGAGRARAEGRLAALFRDAVTGVSDSDALVVLRTRPGMANAVASMLDEARWPELIGTVAGDDTILAVAKPKEAAPSVAARMRAMLGRESQC